MDASDPEVWPDGRYRDLVRFALARLLETTDEDLRLGMPGAAKCHVQVAMRRIADWDGGRAGIMAIGRIERSVVEIKKEIEQLRLQFHVRRRG